MKEKEYICVLCPKSCPILVRLDGDKIVNIQGFSCKKGKEWAIKEVENPQRIFVGSVTVLDGDFDTVSVKSSDFVSRDILKKIGCHTHEISVNAPVKMHQILEKNLMNMSGVDLIATRVVRKKNDVEYMNGC